MLYFQAAFLRLRNISADRAARKANTDAQSKAKQHVYLH